MPARKTFKGERFSLDEAQAYINMLSSYLFPDWITASDKVFYGGSYIRSQQSVGDIDIAVCLDPTEQPLSVRCELPQGFRRDFVVDTLVQGSSMARYVIDPAMVLSGINNLIGHKFQLDIWFVDNIAKWGPLCMFVAGSGKLNIHQRVLASKVGCSLSQYGVSKNGESCGSFPTEQSVYRFFNWPWIPYSRRSWG